MKSEYWTIMWNRRDCGASEMNHHQLQQTLVFIQRRWWKVSVSCKTVKGTWNCYLLKKIKILGRWNYEVAWKMLEGNGTKWWIHCSITFLVKMKRCVLYVPKNQRNFLVNPIFGSQESLFRVDSKCSKREVKWVFS